MGPLKRVIPHIALCAMSYYFDNEPPCFWGLSNETRCSAAAGPVTVKLRFERERPRENGNGFILVAEEVDIDVHASEGLEIFKFQVRIPEVFLLRANLIRTFAC